MLIYRSMCPSGIRRRFLCRWKFGLRTLFVAITLFAVLAGLYGRRMLLINREYSAAEQVVRLGGQIVYQNRQSLVRESFLTRLISFLAFDDFDHVTTVDFEDTPVGDEHIKVLRSFRSVEYVTLDGTLVTDDCIDTLRELPRLKWVGLSGTDVTDAGIDRLKKIHPTLSLINR